MSWLRTCSEILNEYDTLFASENTDENEDAYDNDDDLIGIITMDDEIENEITAEIERMSESICYSSPDTCPIFFVEFDSTRLKCLLDSGAKVSAIKRITYDSIIHRCLLDE